MNIQHSSRSDRWFTPKWIARKVQVTLGTIDLDPASEAKANELIGAKVYLTEDDDGLTRDWGASNPVSVYCNPPGGKRGNQSQTFLFWRRLMGLRRSHGLRHAIFMCFSVEALQTTQGKDVPPIGDFYVCIPKRRIAFDYPDGRPSTGPSHSNAIVYVPGRVNESAVFRAHFEEVGSILSGDSHVRA